MANEVRLEKRELERIIDQLGDHLDDWLAGHAEETASDVKESFGTGPAGREYPRGGGRVHIASAVPGPPAVDTNTLRASIRQEPVAKHHYIVADGTDYGIDLEEGAERTGPRPFMAPALDRRREIIMNETGDDILP